VRQAFICLDESLKKDKEVVLAVVAQDGLALAHVGECLQNDKGVVMAAVAQNGSALEHAGEGLLHPSEGWKRLVLAAVKQDWHALEICLQDQRSEIHKDKEVILAAVAQNAEKHAERRKTAEWICNPKPLTSPLSSAHSTLREDKEFLLTAAALDPEAFREFLLNGGPDSRNGWVSRSELRDDPDLLRAAGEEVGGGKRRGKARSKHD
jgi:hypothetical protein